MLIDGHEQWNIAFVEDTSERRSDEAQVGETELRRIKGGACRPTQTVHNTSSTNYTTSWRCQLLIQRLTPLLELVLQPETNNNHVRTVTETLEPIFPRCDGIISVLRDERFLPCCCCGVWPGRVLLPQQQHKKKQNIR
jgi:hypothetical protein